MHFFKPTLSIGIEAKNNNNITKENGWMNSIIFAGPAFHATIGKCYILVTAMPQFINLHKTSLAPGIKDFNDFEAAEFRILVGYHF